MHFSRARKTARDLAVFLSQVRDTASQKRKKETATEHPKFTNMLMNQ